MALPLTSNITLYRGDDWSQTVTFATGTTTSNTPIDLTGCTIASQIRQSENNGTVLNTIAITNRNDAAGSFTMSLSGALTGVMDSTKFPAVYDVQVTSADGLVTTFMKGTVSLGLDVTK
jgi:hypothetical protein